jgi:hypothetical protein
VWIPTHVHNEILDQAPAGSNVPDCQSALHSSILRVIGSVVGACEDINLPELPEDPGRIHTFGSESGVAISSHFLSNTQILVFRNICDWSRLLLFPSSLP